MALAAAQNHFRRLVHNNAHRVEMRVDAKMVCSPIVPDLTTTLACHDEEEAQGASSSTNVNYAW